MTYYCGIDLHGNNSVVVVIDADDRVVVRRRVDNELCRIAAVLAPHRRHLVSVVVESTYNWYWLVDGLKDLGYRVKLAHATALEPYKGLKHADDASDARWLAQLERLGILPQGHVHPPALRAVRDMLRRRGRLVRQHTANLLSIQTTVARCTGRRLSGNGIKRLRPETVAALGLDDGAAASVEATLSVMAAQQAAIARLERAVLGAVRGDAAFGRLLAVAGIGPVLGLTITLETGDVGRFRGPGNYVSYCRASGTAWLSNGKRKGQGNAKCGNKYLDWAYVEAANFAVRHMPEARRWYQRKAARVGGAKAHTVAIKAVAAKLARAIYFVLRDEVPFDPKRCFG